MGISLTNTGADLNEIRIEKSARRKLTEIALIFWGLFGGIACLYMANTAFQLEMQSPVTRTPLSSPIPIVIMYTFVWVGGLVFLGFLALLAPIKMGLMPNQAAQNSAAKEAFEHTKRPNYRGRMLLVRDDKIATTAGGIGR